MKRVASRPLVQLAGLLLTLGWAPLHLMAQGSADLFIQKSAAVGTDATGGFTVTYTLVAGNNGPDASGPVVVTDNLPAALTVISCSATGGGVCGGTSSLPEVTFSSLAAGGAAGPEVVTLVAKLASGTPDGSVLSNLATLSISALNPAPPADPNPGNNSASATVTIGMPAASAATLSVTQLDFGYQLIGASSAEQAITLSSSGTAPLVVTSVAASGDFAQTNNCVGRLPPRATCVISVTFTPTDSGQRTGAIAVSDDASDSPQMVSLSGMGTARALSVADVEASQKKCKGHNAIFTVTLRPTSRQPVSVRYGTSDGSAVAGKDYTATTGTLVFDPGAKSQVVEVPVADVMVPGPDKVFFLNLSGATGAAIADGQGTAVILAPAQVKCAMCALSCSDGSVCTTDSCDAQLGCRNVPKSCDDGQACTTDGCDAITGCRHVDVNRCANPVCSLGNCAGPDSDGDGLNDAWESAGYIDVNCNGTKDEADVELPGAELGKPDVYVQYDWMDYGPNEFACSTNADCTNQGPAHAGETCTGPAIPARAHTCSYACVTDSDCTSRGGASMASHVGEKCVANACVHSHDPELIAPGALDAVAESFAAHGIGLHILRGQAQPHSHVLSFRPLADLTNGCEGGSLSASTAGAGNYAESLYDLKPATLNPQDNPAFHYAIFGHLSACDTDAHCNACVAPLPAFGQTGQAEITGNDLIISLGNFINDQGAAPTVFNVGGTFMHELGHNLGLHHGGGVTAPGTDCVAPDCEDGPLYKPNYLSVMNYKYQLTGIFESDIVGASRIVGQRLDFSNQTLPVGGNTPGELTENGELNEIAGLGSGTADVFTFDDGQCRFQMAASDGPVDWDGDGFATNPTATSDLNTQDHPLNACSFTTQVHRGHTDWDPAAGQSIFNYRFQCGTPNFADGVGVAGLDRLAKKDLAVGELTPKLAVAAHALYPPRRIHILLQPGSPAKTIAPGRQGRVLAVLLGEEGFDVTEVEMASLGLHGATAGRSEIRDVNGDGKLDLLIEFDMAKIRLHREAKSARLTGWLKNSQVVFGEDRITVTSNVDSRCR